MDTILAANVQDFIKTDLKTYCESNLKRLYEAKYQAIYEDKNDSKSLLEFDILENEIVRLLEKNNQVTSDRQVLETYRRYVLNYLNKYPEMFITSTIVTRDDISRNFFKQDYDKVIKYRETYYKKVLPLYARFVKKETLSRTEEKMLFCYFQATVGNVNSQNIQEMQKLLVKEILSRKQVDLTGKKFLIDYFSYRKCKALNLPVTRTYIGNKTPYNSSMENKYGVSIGDTGIICFNEDFLKSPGNTRNKDHNLLNNTLLIHVINHEIEHYKDSIEYQNNEITIGAWKMLKNRLLRKYLSTQQFNEYMINYRYKESENTANKQGYRETKSILQGFFSEEEFGEEFEILNNKIKETQFGIAEAYQQGVNKQPETLEKYNIENLERITFDHKELVGKHRLLQLFFEPDGKCKNGETIVREYTKIITNPTISKEQKRNYKEIYNEMFDYLFQTTELELFSISNLNEEEQIVWFKETRSSYARECRRLKDMMDIYQPNKSKQFDFIAAKRIERIRKYYNYLTSNKEMTERLTSINAKRENRIYPILELGEDSLKEDVASFQKRISTWNLAVTADSKLAHEIKKLSEIENSVTSATTQDNRKINH
ncbi:MAG: hypothetical protein PUE33_02725 [bacterium]|nr:hypothetical protein [bacterium]